MKEWYCPYRVRGLGDEATRAAHGVDAVQALQLAEQAIAATLDREPRLRWLGRDHGFPRSDKWIGNAWHRAVSFAWDGRQRSPVPGPWPLEVYAAPAPAEHTLLFTKPFLLRLWLRAGRLPPRTDVLVHYGVPSARVCDLVRAQLPPGRRALFVGDLDPLDLAVYVAFRRGGVGPGRGRSVPVTYAGIDDRWLELCRRYARKPGLGTLIRLSGRERQQLRALERAGLDFEATGGIRCSALLRSGYKLETEGATNPHLYRPRLYANLRRELIGGR